MKYFLEPDNPIIMIPCFASLFIAALGMIFRSPISVLFGIVFAIVYFLTMCVYATTRNYGLINQSRLTLWMIENTEIRLKQYTIESEIAEDQNNLRYDVEYRICLPFGWGIWDAVDAGRGMCSKQYAEDLYERTLFSLKERKHDVMAHFKQIMNVEILAEHKREEGE